MNDPNHTLGTDKIQKTKSSISIVGKGTAAEDCSSQWAKLMTKHSIKTKQGKSIEVSIVQRSQSAP